MTADELVNHISDQMVLSAPDAKARILKELNIRYRTVTSSIGLVTTRRVEVTQPVTLNSQIVVFTGVEKLDAIFYKVTQNNVTTNNTLDEITNDEMIKERIRSSTPSKFSVFTISPNSVTIKINLVQTTGTPLVLYADGLADASSLSGTASPAFPASFHDILIHGVEADEYKRKEKAQLAADAEQKFESRLSDLRMFIAKSAYMDLHRGKHAKAEDWWDYNRNQ